MAAKKHQIETSATLWAICAAINENTNKIPNNLINLWLEKKQLIQVAVKYNIIDGIE